MTLRGDAPADLPEQVLRAFPGAPRSVPAPARLATVAYARAMDEAAADRLVSRLDVALVDLEAVALTNVVVGLSGGLDSVVTVRLCQRAGRADRRVLAVTVDLGRPGEAERVEAIRKTAHHLGVDHRVIDAAALRTATFAAWPPTGPWSAINTDTRLIQSLLFRVADSTAAAVVATTDRSEHLLGRYTECFYGHVEPLGDLYKTEVLPLAETLGVANLVADQRPGCEDYWYDDQVLGAGWGTIDPILHLLVVEGRTPAEVGEQLGVADVDWIERIASRVRVQPARLRSTQLRASSG